MSSNLSFEIASVIFEHVIEKYLGTDALGSIWGGENIPSHNILGFTFQKDQISKQFRALIYTIVHSRTDNDSDQLINKFQSALSHLLLPSATEEGGGEQIDETLQQAEQHERESPMMEKSRLDELVQKNTSKVPRTDPSAQFILGIDSGEIMVRAVVYDNDCDAHTFSTVSAAVVRDPLADEEEDEASPPTKNAMNAKKSTALPPEEEDEAPPPTQASKNDKKKVVPVPAKQKQATPVGKKDASVQSFQTVPFLLSFLSFFLFICLLFSETKTISVYVKDATIVKGSTHDVFGKGDTYVNLKLAGQEKRTKVQPKTRTPYWNEDLIFDDVPINTREIIVELRDEDPVGPDAIIGSAKHKLDLSQTDLDQAENLELVNAEGKPQAKISIEIDPQGSGQQILDNLGDGDEEEEPAMDDD